MTVRIVSTTPILDEFLVMSPGTLDVSVARADVGKPVYWQLSDVINGDKVLCSLFLIAS